MLSIIIPAYKEKYLNRTIRSLLWNKRGDIEIIVVLDGADQRVKEHHRVHVIRLPDKRGMRHAINIGVAIARGELIMKCDAHCKFAKGFDLALQPKENEVMVPRKYKLNVDEWKEYDKPTDFQKLVIHPGYGKFQGQPARRKGPDIMETLAFQGSCWVMHKAWYEKLNLLDAELFTPFGHESVEISMKTWQNGGKVLVNKTTWYAHADGLKRTHQPADQEKLWKWAVDYYKNDYQKYVLSHPLYKI